MSYSECDTLYFKMQYKKLGSNDLFKNIFRVTFSLCTL